MSAKTNETALPTGKYLRYNGVKYPWYRILIPGDDDNFIMTKPDIAQTMEFGPDTVSAIKTPQGRIEVMRLNSTGRSAWDLRNGRYLGIPDPDFVEDALKQFGMSVKKKTGGYINYLNLF